MKLIDQVTILRETAECNTAEEATATIQSHQWAGWRISNSWYENSKWYYTFEKVVEEGK